MVQNGVLFMKIEYRTYNYSQVHSRYSTINRLINGVSANVEVKQYVYLNELVDCLSLLQ